MNTKSKRLLQTLLVFCFSLFLQFNAFALMDGMSTFDVQGPVAREQLHVFWWTLAIVVFLTLTVGGVFFYTLIRFRSKPGEDDAVPEQSHGNANVEIALIIASCILLLVIAVPNAKALFLMDAPPKEEGEPIKVVAIGHQWWWEFQYPDLGITTANELHIPAGRPVDFDLKSADVLHSFWVPKLAGKMDVIPGQINKIWFKADKADKFYGQCTEFCGDSHANMRFLVYSHEQADFDQWVREQKKDGVKPETPDQVNGQQVFMKGCNSCHAVKGTGAMGVVGPDLTHFGSRDTLGAAIYDNTDENLAKWLRDPKGMKPGNLMNLEQVNMVLSDRDVNALVAYLKSLK